MESLVLYPIFIPDKPKKNPEEGISWTPIIILVGAGIAYYFWQQQKRQVVPAMIIPGKPGVVPKVASIPTAPVYKGVNWLDILSGSGGKFAEGISTAFKPTAPTTPTVKEEKKLQRKVTTVDITVNDSEKLAGYEFATKVYWSDGIIGTYSNYGVSEIEQLKKNWSNANYIIHQGNVYPDFFNNAFIELKNRGIDVKFVG